MAKWYLFFLINLIMINAMHWTFFLKLAVSQNYFQPMHFFYFFLNSNLNLQIHSLTVENLVEKNVSKPVFSSTFDKSLNELSFEMIMGNANFSQGYCLFWK